MPPTYEEKDSLHGSAGSPPFSNWGSSNLPEAFYPLNALLRWRRRHFPSTGVRRLEAPLRRRVPLNLLRRQLTEIELRQLAEEQLLLGNGSPVTHHRLVF